MNVMNKRGRQPLHARILEDLRQQIMSGRLVGGTQLPTEAELAKRYDVSVPTVRQAQFRLVEEGLIDKQQGRGTFVTGRKVKPRLLLVCALAKNSGPDPYTLSPYFQNTLWFCEEKFAAAGMEMDIVWERNLPTPGAGSASDAVLTGYNGYVFVGCTDEHRLLVEARARGLNYVNLGKDHAGPGCVWYDPAEALQLAIDRMPAGNSPIFVVASTTADSISGVLRQSRPHPLIPLSAAIHSRATNWVYECRAYELVQGVCRNFPEAGYIFLDDILARGGTRALLEADASPSQVAVICGRQEIFPYGMSVTFIIHDTEREAQWAVEMLTAQLQGTMASGAECRQSHYAQALSLTPAAETLEAVG